MARSPVDPGPVRWRARVPDRQPGRNLSLPPGRAVQRRAGAAVQQRLGTDTAGLRGDESVPKSARRTVTRAPDPAARAMADTRMASEPGQSPPSGVRPFECYLAPHFSRTNDTLAFTRKADTLSFSTIAWNSLI